MRRNIKKGALPSLTQAETMELRSCAFTNLLAVTTTLDRRQAGRVIDRAHQELLQMGRSETDRWLGEHMVKMLNHPLYASRLTRVQKAESLTAWETRKRTKYDVKNIIDEEGFIRWEHVCGPGEGFFESYKWTIQKPDIYGGHFRYDLKTSLTHKVSRHG